MLQDSSCPGKPEQVPLDYYEGLNPVVFSMVPLTCTRILEVGCAKGKLGAAIKNRNPGTYYVGIELFEEAGALASNHLDKVFVSDVEHFDWGRLAGENFDCIIFADVLEHLVDPAAVFRKATSLLSEGGNVVCCIPNVGHWSVISNLIRGDWNYTETGLMDRTHLRFFTLPTFRKFLNECGFESIEEERWYTKIELHETFFSLVQALKVDPRVFVNQATTIQFMVKAKRIAKKGFPLTAEGRFGSTDPGTPRNLVAIVITASNQLKLNIECLNSIATSFSNSCQIQVIVVDDASTDETATLLKAASAAFPWLHFVRCDKPIGLARARNWGATLTDAEFLVFLDGNSIVKSGWLEKMTETLEDARVGMVSPQLISVDGKIANLGIVFTADANPKLLHPSADPTETKVSCTLELPAITGACMMIRRGIFQALEGFSTVAPIFYGDLDLCFKVRNKGLAIIYQPACQIIQAGSENAAAIPMTKAVGLMSRNIFIEKWKDFLLKELGENPAFYFQGKEYSCN